MEALLPLIITFGLMWALLIRPQQRRVRQHQDLVATLAAGDEVITTGGMVGTIVSVVDDIITLEVAPGVSIRVLRAAIQTRIAADDSSLDPPGIDEDLDALEDAYAEDAYSDDSVVDELPIDPPAPPRDITGVMPVTPPPPPPTPADPTDPPSSPGAGEKA